MCSRNFSCSFVMTTVNALLNTIHPPVGLFWRMLFANNKQMKRASLSFSFASWFVYHLWNRCTHITIKISELCATFMSVLVAELVLLSVFWFNLLNTMLLVTSSSNVLSTFINNGFKQSNRFVCTRTPAIRFHMSNVLYVCLYVCVFTTHTYVYNVNLVVK